MSAITSTRGARSRGSGERPRPTRRPAAGLTADDCATVLATCLRPRCTGCGLERPKTAERRGLVDGAIVALLFHGALRRSEVAVLCWADVDFSDGDDIVVTVRRSKSDPTGGRADVRRLVGSCAAAVRSLHAAVSQESGAGRTPPWWSATPRASARAREPSASTCAERTAVGLPADRRRRRPNSARASAAAPGLPRTAPDRVTSTTSRS